MHPSVQVRVWGLTRVGDAAVCDELGQQNAEGPDVRLDGELAVVGRLRGGPLDREPDRAQTHDTR